MNQRSDAQSFGHEDEAPATACENSAVIESDFWHPPLWKWAVFLVLMSSAAWLLLRNNPNRPVRIKLLRMPDSRPTWNGSYPYIVFSLTDPEAGPVTVKSSILLIKPTMTNNSPVNEFRVDLHSGKFILRQTDLFIPDVNPLVLTRTYRVWDLYNRAFGIGTGHPYDICPTGRRFPYEYMDLNLEDGRQIHFRRISEGTGYADAVFRHDETSSEFYGAQIAWNGNGWTLSFHDRRRVLFPEAYHAKNCAQGAPTDISDGEAHRIELQRDDQRNLKRLTSPSGHTITFKYDGDRIIQASDDTGRVRNYSYDRTGHLQTVADGSSVLYRFEYALLIHSPGYDPYLMTAVTDGRGKVLLRNLYRDGSRVSEQRLGNGDVYRYDYIFLGNEIIETIVNGPAGRRIFFFRNGVFEREE